MIDLLETCLEVAQNYAHDSESAQLLAGACEMGVVQIFDEDEDTTIRGINIFLSTECTDDDPAFIQVGIDDDGEIILDCEIEESDLAEMLDDQIEQAKERIEFCQEVMTALGIAPRMTPGKQNKTRRYRNAV